MMRTRRVAVVAVIAAWSSGCGDERRRPAPPAFECAPLVARLRRCADPFWSAYGTTARAQANAADGQVAAHVAEARATFEAVGLDRLCEQERARAGSPGWQRRLLDCAAISGCPEWAACVAPAMFDGL